MNTEQIIETAIQGHASTRDAIRWAMQQEREACAKVCESQQNRIVQRHPARVEFDPNNMMALKCAAVIRARGNE